ncbi:MULTISPECIES: helix-turn-helix transcriptional regulator [unclassified Mesorhizobium]|uniref:helix-turn-helix transcriptional regulator n=1 Tax=unclassified Mesorhizobium TaxID=325217 RepID=UPI0003CF6FA8|nr:helix-turn-helix transcriptional regulator [Mesorhizobium sp. LSHC420B00]ESX78770.1 transcriptional regulator [Mesorhizobium sp. LSHC420B00]
MVSGEVAGRRLTVLIVLRDVERARSLSAALAATDDLQPFLAGEVDGRWAADVAIVDDHGVQGGLVDAAMPRVLLSSRAAGERPADTVFAVLPVAADDVLIAAAARLAAAGYRISRDSHALSDGHDFTFHDSDRFDEEPSNEQIVRPTLSPRESEVLALLAEGAPNKVIARRLNISVHTAKFHVAAILTKLGAANRTDAIAIAMRQGLVLV